MITIVSGLPRSGTSLMMQMLAAGGLTAVTDQIREADTDNPRGYFEWEAVKRLAVHPAMLEQAEGKVVKIVSSLLVHLPLNHEYRIVFMRRPIGQVLASQAEMIRRRGGPVAPALVLRPALEAHCRSVAAWLGERSSLATHWVDYPELISSPREQALKVAEFVGGGLDTGGMIAAIDPALFRFR